MVNWKAPSGPAKVCCCDRPELAWTMARTGRPFSSRTLPARLAVLGGVWAASRGRKSSERITRPAGGGDFRHRSVLLPESAITRGGICARAIFPVIVLFLFRLHQECGLVFELKQVQSFSDYFGPNGVFTIVRYFSTVRRRLGSGAEEGGSVEGPCRRR